jgi:hypothetical protein
MPSGNHPRALKPLLLIPIAALLAILPLILHGASCGHDQVFHIQGWLDAAHQLRHGIYPRWSSTSAWNAGEPRFLFYPPLSWLLGAILTTIFPIAACPTIYIFIALLASGLTFHRLASHFATPNAALLAAALYLANPYMLFNAFERSALSELLAAAWIPLLLLALLRARPTLRGIALPLALLWLTNAPAAVIGSYTLALLATLRVLTAIFTPSKLSSRPEAAHFADAAEKPLYLSSSTQTTPLRNPETTAPPTTGYPEPLGSGLIASQKVRGFSPWGTPLRLTLTYLSGTLLGLALPAFYLLPAAYERRYVQVAMALVPGMSPQNNFLFTRTTDPGHNGVNQQASLLALTLLILTAVTLLILLLKKTSTPEKPVILSEVSRGLMRETQSKDLPPSPHLALLLTLLTALIAFLLTPLSTPLWQHLPELAFLQFPWRLLTLLAPILALTIALLLNPHPIHLSPSAQDLDSETWVRRMSTPAALLLPLILGFYAFHLYAQSCNPNDLPTNIAQHLATHHGFAPTDEYTPTTADNDPLRTDNPAYWLIPATADPNTPAPNTTPTLTELNPNLDTDDIPIPLAQTLSTPAPHHLTLNLPQPERLILNLRAYPNWHITRSSATTTQLPPSAQVSAQDRDDGLITLALPAGPSIIDITWHRTPDQTLGLTISFLALIALALTFRRQRPKPRE